VKEHEYQTGRLSLLPRDQRGAGQYQLEFGVRKGANEVVFVREVKPNRFGDVARRFTVPKTLSRLCPQG